MLIFHFKRGKDKKERKKPIGKGMTRAINVALGISSALGGLALATALGYMAHGRLKKAVNPTRKDIQQIRGYANLYR